MVNTNGTRGDQRPLAVFSPIIGRWGQPWIKAHIDNILPGRSVVIALCVFEPRESCWGVDAPTLFIPPRLGAAFKSEASHKTMLERLPAGHRTRFRSPEHARRIKRFLRDNGVEVILAQWLDESLPLVDMAAELGVRYCCMAHGTDITTGANNAAVRRAYSGYNTTDAVVAPSEFGRQQLLQVGIDPERAHVVRHAVDASATWVKKEPGPVRCLAAGRLHPMKGPHLVIEAFGRTLDACPDLHLDYVGDGDLMSVVRQLARDLCIEDRVTFHGFVAHERVLELMKRCHIFLQPSVEFEGRYDTCPVGVAEAMAAGMAVVASRHGGIPEQIVDGESGFLVREHDTRAMAERLVALANDTSFRERVGRAAWRRARELFCPATVRSKWLDLLGLSGYA